MSPITFQAVVDGVPVEATLTFKPLAQAAAPAPLPAKPTLPAIALMPPADVFYQVGGYWVENGVWGADQLVLGPYTGLAGTTYEQAVGVGLYGGPDGAVTWRTAWGWPTGTTEVKAYPSVLYGAKPGFANSWICPGGKNVILPDGSMSLKAPSGATPDSWLPLQLPVPERLYSTFNYKHLSPPTGRGHLTYDIWLQHTPAQTHGWGEAPISHEIMIPLDYWGDYGAYHKRNPGWYDHDAWIDGRLWHVYCNKGEDGVLRPDFGGRWKWICFEPDAPVLPGSIALAEFINYLATRKDAAGTPWATGTEYLVSVELGVEPVDGTGDLEVFGYKLAR